MTDCLIIGFNDYDLDRFIAMVQSMGKHSGAYRDLNLAFVTHRGKAYRALDVLTHFHSPDKGGANRPFSNVDFLWPTISYLGSYLTRRNFTFDYVNLFHAEKPKLRQKLESGEVLSVAITTTLYVSPQPILEIIDFIRDCNPRARIIVGGPYIGNQVVETPADQLQNFYHALGADIYVDSNEGEAALVNILRALKEGGSLSGLANVVYRDGDRYVINSKAVESNPLEENPIDYDVFPKGDLGEFISLRTAKSCPFACAFCGFPKRAGKYKYLPPDLVERELTLLRERTDATTLTFLDDTFNVPKERFREILKMMIRNRFGFRWNSFFRSDHADEEIIDLMGQAGCEGVFLGVESGSDTILAKMNKSARTKDYRRVIPLLKKAGIFTHASLVIGFPGETQETFRETHNFIEEVQPDTFRAQLWYADPVTPVWEHRVELGIVGSAFQWSHHTMDHQTACDLVEKMFLSIENSVWLPQNGFEMWSVFYLQRRGMAVRQIKTFLRCFNALIKEKLLQPERKEPDPLLWENLAQSCRYTDLHYREPEVPEVYGAARYKAAEAFWVSHFDSETPPDGMIFPGETTTENHSGEEVLFRIEKAALEKLADCCQTTPGECVLAAFAVFLLGTSASSDCVVLCNQPGAAEETVFPARIRSEWEMTFASLAASIHSTLTTVSKQGPFGLHIVTNTWRMASYGAKPISPRVACRWFDTKTGLELNGLADCLEAFPTVSKAVKLQLDACPDGDQIAFHLRGASFSQESLIDFADFYKSIVLEACLHPASSVQAMLSGKRSINAMTPENADDSMFNFGR